MDYKKDMRLNILMVVAMLTWGLSWTNAKILGQYADAPLIMVWRFFFASLSFAPFLKLTNDSLQLTKNNIYFILGNPLCMVSYNYFYFKGTQIGLAGAGGVLVTTLNPILTALFANLIFGSIMQKKDWIGLGLGLIGGAFIIRIWEMDISQMVQTGNLFFILASLSWVCVTIITSRSKNTIPFMAYSFWSFTFACLLSIPISMNEDLLIIFNFDHIFWLNLFMLSVLAMSFGTSIYFLASLRLGAKRSSSYIFLVPLTAMGFAMYFLSEPLLLSTLIGGILGIMSVYLINKE